MPTFTVRLSISIMSEAVFRSEGQWGATDHEQVHLGGIKPSRSRLGCYPARGSKTTSTAGLPPTSMSFSCLPATTETKRKMSKPNPLLLYLDQAYWGRIASPCHEKIGRFLAHHVESGAVSLPISDVTILETMKFAPHKRASLLPWMERLSTGLAITSFPVVVQAELERHREGRALKWMRGQLVSQNPVLHDFIRMNTDPQMIDAIRQVSGISVSRIILKKVNEIFQRGAAAATTKTKHSPVSYRRSEISKVVGLPEAMLPSEDEKWQDIFQSIAVRDALQGAIVRAKPDGMEPNDLADIQFLWITLPYFDVVTVDRPMAARIREADLGKLAHAKVVHRIENLVETVEMCLAAGQHPPRLPAGQNGCVSNET